MIPFRLPGIQILRVSLATVLVTSPVLGAATAGARRELSGPISAPRLSEAERPRQLQDRDRIRAVVTKLAQAGRLDESVAAAFEELAATRKVQDEIHEDVVVSLQMLARLQEKRDDWPAARKAMTNAIAIRAQQTDQKDWRIADAHLRVADLDQRARLDPRRRRRHQEADRLNRLRGALFKLGKYAEGIDPCQRAMDIRGEMLGENHPKSATSMNNLDRQIVVENP
jgi:hypothetical protein